MITTTLIEDAKVLVPNKEHQNFNETSEILPKGAEVTGNQKNIQGLRRGQPFTYKLFFTNNNKLIYLKSIKPMETEVQLGADATVVNLKQNILAKPGILGAVSGAVLAFGYWKYKKHDVKKLWLHVALGAAAGFVAGKVIAHVATVKQPK